MTLDHIIYGENKRFLLTEKYSEEILKKRKIKFQGVIVHNFLKVSNTINESQQQMANLVIASATLIEDVLKIEATIKPEVTIQNANIDFTILPSGTTLVDDTEKNKQK